MATPIVLRLVIFLMTSLCLFAPVQVFAEIQKEPSSMEEKLNKLLAEIHTKGAVETPVLQELKKLIPELEKAGAGELPALKDLKRLLLELEKEKGGK